MDTGMKSFLEEGVKQYAEAKHTIAAFENELVQLLKAAVDKREDHWSPLIKRTVTVNRPKAGGGDGFYISVAIWGKSPRFGDAEIDCGLWWDAPQITKPIIYASFYYKPERVVGFAWTGQKGGIRSFAYHRRTFLYIPLTDKLEIEKSINSMIDVLLKKLK